MSTLKASVGSFMNKCKYVWQQRRNNK